MALLPDLRKKQGRFTRAVEETITEKFWEGAEEVIAELQEELETGELRVERREGGESQLLRKIDGLAQEVRLLKKGLGEFRDPAVETYADIVKCTIGESQKRPTKKVVIKPVDGSDKKTVDEIKEVIKKAIKPEEGLKIDGLRKGRSGVVVIVADEGSWLEVRKNRGLKDKGRKEESPAERMPRVAIYGMKTGIGEEGICPKLQGKCQRKNF